MTDTAQETSATRRALIPQFLLFTGVGAIGTAGHYLVLVAMVQISGIAPVYASACGFVVGALINYYLNYRYTFDSTKSHAETLFKFMTVATLGFAVNGGIMALGTEWASFNYLFVQLAATATVLLFNFSLNRCWTFAIPGSATTEKNRGPTQ